MSQLKKRVHLFNCDNIFELESVEKLLEKSGIHVEGVQKHYFRLPKMSEMADEIPILEMDMAFFVVHAHECALSINEDDSGIGYAKLCSDLLQATGGNVIIVIGGDDKYKGEDEENREVISRWAKRKVFSQFDEEYLDGRRSFIFSWNKQHRKIHEQAMLHHFDPNKKGQKFEYRPHQRKTQPKAVPSRSKETAPPFRRCFYLSDERQYESNPSPETGSFLHRFEAITGIREVKEEKTSSHLLDSKIEDSSISRDRETTTYTSNPMARSKEIIGPRIGETIELAILSCDVPHEFVKDVEKFLKSLPSSLLHLSENLFVANLPITEVEEFLKYHHFRFLVLLVDGFTVRDGYDNQRSKELQRLVRLALDKGVEKVTILLCSWKSTKGEGTCNVFTTQISKIDKASVVELINGRVTLDPDEFLKVAMSQERPSSSLKHAYENFYSCHPELRDCPSCDSSEGKGMHGIGAQNTPQPVLATQLKENPFPVVLLRGIARYGKISERMGDLQIWDPEFRVPDDFQERLLKIYGKEPEIGVIVIKSSNGTPEYFIDPNLKEFLLEKEISLRPGERLVLKTRVRKGEISFKEEDVQFRYGNLPIPQYIIDDLQRNRTHGDLFVISDDSGKFRLTVTSGRLDQVTRVTKILNKYSKNLTKNQN